MKAIPLTLMTAFFVTFVPSLMAEAPKKQPLNRYKTLWTGSLMTAKPPPPEKVEDKTFEDWTLAGVANTPTGPRVTLMNKRDRTQRITISDGRVVDGFEVVSVNMAKNYTKSTVKVRANGKVGEIGVDLKAVTLKASPRKNQRAAQNGQRKNGNAKRNTKNTGAPPVPGLNTKKTNSNQKKPTKRPRIVRPRKN